MFEKGCQFVTTGAVVMQSGRVLLDSVEEGVQIANHTKQHIASSCASRCAEMEVHG